MPVNLDAIDWKDTRYPGISLAEVYRPTSHADVVVLIRMQAGCGYPRHRHVGRERVLVLQGSYADENGRYVEGQVVEYAAGTAHTPVAERGPEPCVLLATAYQGIELVDGH